MNEADSNAALLFISRMKDHRIFAFHGDMGAGKTTFIKAVCKALGVEEVVNSPTFSIVNEYRIESTNQRIFHFDFYRINRLDEAEDLGLQDYFYSANLCFIEWPDIIEPYLPDDTLHVFIRENPDGSRTLEMP
ncbi:MAG: tRNA (adenosine(37)-N6)-threonylcarbamoyltransferase complex ATPase subunit type 1 TsaE [Tannerellaceae bacterium]|jgi:tRNA threonylcarbamoyladenosine biosynthesis protein TsaE|nr:tRNA (adenosine(37)-N6)-threonylcarbamoyltransferase complex ATPase subunit type 1 TsaE [Tannerellaceae bacterium]